MSTTLYLARHGETRWNKHHRIQGQLDSKLTDKGKQQSLAIVQQLKQEKLDLIVSSTLGRAISSAEICQQQLNIRHISIPQLAERNLGDWQGRCINELQQLPHYHEVLQQVTHLPVPNGESAIACGQRIYRALAVLCEKFPRKNILVVFHGEALRCFSALLGYQQQRNAYNLFKNGSVYPLKRLSHKPTFEFIN